MTGQPQLWTPSVEAVHLQAFYDHPYGWAVQLNARREAQTWADGPTEAYSELTVWEAYDVCSASLYGLLDLDRQLSHPGRTS